MDAEISESISRKTRQLLGIPEPRIEVVEPQNPGRPYGSADAGKGSGPGAEPPSLAEQFTAKNERLTEASRLGLHYSDPRLKPSPLTRR